MSIRKDLKKIPKNNLVELLVSLHGIYGDIDEIIERHIEAVTEPKKDEEGSLQDLLEQQIQQLANEDEFIGYF